MSIRIGSTNAVSIMLDPPSVFFNDDDAAGRELMLSEAPPDKML
jgi:hypothetical protein